MTRWRYKTLHFDLKKDGILGSFFLDEEELEQSLCRHGQEGWELVAVLDVQGGLVALCKQPFSEEDVLELEPLVALRREEEDTVPDAKIELLAKPATKPRAGKPAKSERTERPVSLFDEPDDDVAPLDGPRIDTGGDEEGSHLSNIKIE